MKKSYRHDELSNVQCIGYPIGTCNRYLKRRIVEEKRSARLCYLCYKMEMRDTKGHNVKPQTIQRYKAK